MADDVDLKTRSIVHAASDAPTRIEEPPVTQSDTPTPDPDTPRDAEPIPEPSRPTTQPGEVPDVDHPVESGRYRILSHIAEGGMGTVYKAEQLKPITRIVAIKV